MVALQIVSCLAPECGREVVLCIMCNLPQGRYCGCECAQRARRARRLAAGRQYQQSQCGRRKHMFRQRRYVAELRARKRDFSDESVGAQDQTAVDLWSQAWPRRAEKQAVGESPAPQGPQPATTADLSTGFENARKALEGGTCPANARRFRAHRREAHPQILPTRRRRMTHRSGPEREISGRVESTTTTLRTGAQACCARCGRVGVITEAS